MNAHQFPPQVKVYDILHQDIVRPNFFLSGSHSYWNLYFTDQGLFAVRIYDGIWAKIGALVGLPMAIWPFLITMLIGAKLDEIQGRNACKSYAMRLNDILADYQRYEIEHHDYYEMVEVGERETFVLNFFERYKIRVGDCVYYTFKSSINVVGPVFSRHFQKITLKMGDKHE